MADDKASAKGQERSRADEAKADDRPIDPTTGEKEGLGPRDEAVEVPADGSASESVEIESDDSGSGDENAGS